MLFKDSVGGNASDVETYRGARGRARAASKWRNGVSMLGIALAGATLLAAPDHADELDLNGTTVARIDFDKTSGVPYTFVENGTLQLINSGALAYDGVLRDNKGSGGGTFSLQKYGPGTLTLTGANTYSGGTSVQAGTLEAGSAGAIGTRQLTVSQAYFTAVTDGLSFANAVTITNSAINTNGFDLTLAGPVSGSNFTKFGLGTLTLSGNNTITSGISITGGGIAVGSNTALGSNSFGLYGGTSLIAAADGVVIANVLRLVGGAPITFDSRASALTLNGELEYADATAVTLNKAGTGMLVVNGHWIGSSIDIINVDAGTLQVNGQIETGHLNIADGAKLSGTGSVSTLSGGGATVTIANGGVLSPGTTAPGTLTVDDLILNTGSTLNFKLGKAGLANGVSNDLVIVKGALTLAGTLNVANGPFFTSGTYTLFTYGSHTGNTLSLGTLPSGYAGTVSVVAGPGTTGSIILSASGTGRQSWDGNGQLADGIASGGSGTWNAKSFDWTSANGNSNSVWNNQQAVFGTVGGNVTVAGKQRFTLLQFDVTDYHLSGTGLFAVSPDGIAAPEINTAANTASVVDNVVSGAHGLLKSGLGTLTLNGANIFSGAVQISGGRVNAGSSGAFSGSAVELLDRTTLGAGTAITLANNLTLDNRATVDSNGFAVALNGAISGPGALTVTDTGSVALAGLVTLASGNSYTGGTTIADARASIAADSTLGGAGGLTLDNGSLLTSASFSSGRAVTLTGDSRLGPASATTLTLDGVINGTGTLTKLGSGGLTLTGSNSYRGATAVSAGTLTVNGSNGGTGAVAVQTGAVLAGSGSIAGVVTVADGATLAPGTAVPGTLTISGLVFGNSANLAYQLGQANVVGGPSNSLLQINGALTLGGNLAVTDSGGFGPGVYRLINYTGALTNNGLSVTSLPGVFGGVIQTIAPGTVNLLITTPNALVQYWDGADQAGNGQIDGGSGSWTTASVDWTSAAPSTINSSWAGGVAVFSAAAGTVTVTGTQAVQGLQFTTAGYLLTGGTINVAAGSFIATGGGTTTIASTLTGGSIIKQGAGTLVLTGANNFAALGLAAGGDTVSLGSNTAGGSGTIALAGGTTLAAGAAGVTLANAVTTAGAGTLDSGAGVFTLNGTVSGPGSITKAGSGALVFNNTANSFTGLDVVAGTVRAGGNISPPADNSFGTGLVTLANGTTLAGNGGVSNLANAVAVTGSVRTDPGDRSPPFQGPIGVLRLSGNITGSGTITKVGTGILFLDGANSFAGLTIAGGTVSANGQGSVGLGAIALADGTTFASSGTYSNAFTVAGTGYFIGGPTTLNGVIFGPGSVNSTATLTLNGVNSYHGLTISGGSVTIGNNTAIGSAGIAFTGIGMTGTPTLIAGVSGIVLSNATSIFSAGIIDPGAGVLTLSGQITGQGSLTKVGSGNLVLNGNNSFTGANVQGLTVEAGTVTLGTNTAAGSGFTTLSNGSTLAAGVSGLKIANAVQVTDSAVIDSGSGQLTLTGQVRGLPNLNSGIITKVGTGNLALTGFLSVAQLNIAAGRLTLDLGGGATSSAMTINLGGGTTLATVSGEYIGGPVVTAGAGTIDSGVNGLNLGGVLSGAGGVTKTGSGTLTISGGSTFGGTTTVAAGTLAVNSAASGTGAITVQPGATFSGSGSIAGVLTIASGATLSPGNGTGTLSTGSLVLNGGANLAYALGQPDVIGGGFNSLLQVNGNLTLGGGLTVTSGGGFGSGVYRLVNYTGALTNNGLGITSLPGGNSGQIQTAIGGTVNLVVTAPNTLIQYWDGADAVGNGKIDGGSGSWTAAGTTWTSAAPSTINSSWAGGVAVFSGTAGHVAITGTQAFQGLQFASPGDVLTGGTLAAGAGAFIATSGGTSTISSAITGSGAVGKQGAGILALNGDNSFTGLNIIGGSVLLGSNTAGGTGAIALMDGTTLAGVNGLELANAVTTAGAGTVDTGGGRLSLSGIISGPGSIAKSGIGSLVLGGVNSFDGLNVNTGSVTLGTSTAGGSGGIALADGTSLVAGVSGLTVANHISTAGVGTVDTGSGALTLAGVVSGPGAVSKSGSGSLVLNGNNSFAGLIVNTGAVTLGTSTAAGSGNIALADGTALIAGATGLVVANTVTAAGIATVDGGGGVLTLGGSIGGPESISKIGSGNLVLNGSNSFNGLTVTAGTVTAGTGTAGGSSGIALADGTTLAAGITGLVLANAVSTAGAGTLDSGAGIFTLAGPITGPGSISKAGTGNLVLSGNNSFIGLTVNAGTLTAGSNSAAGTGGITLADGATLAAGVTGLVLANRVATAGAGTIDSGTGVLTLGGTISGPGSITKANSGTLVLHGDNSFTGLNVAAGTLNVGAATAAGTGFVVLAGGTTLTAGVTGLKLANAFTTAGVGTVNTNGFDLTLNGPITGTGSIVETGGGSLNLGGLSSYAGATIVASGQLHVLGSLTNSTVTVASGASLRGTGSVAGLIATSGSTVAPGLGSATGTLAVAGNAVFQPGSTFAVDVSAPDNDRLTVGGTAALAGTLRLNQLAGPLAPAASYTLLSAAGGRSGTFSTMSYGNLTYNQAFAPIVTFTVNNVLLGLQPKSLVTQAGGGVLTANERNVAVAYDAATAAGFLPTAFAALFAPGLNVPDALNQLSGEIHSAERRVAMDDTRHVREAAFDRLGAGLAVAPGKDDSAATTERGGRSYTLWARGVGAWGTNRSDRNGSSYNTSTGGAIVGIDIGFEGGKIGALFNYTTTTLNHDALGQSKVESTGGAIYAGYRQEHGFAAAAGASIAGIKARSNRTITIPELGQNLTAQSSGNTYQAFADVSYDLPAGTTTRVGPFLRFAWVALETAAFAETGGSAALTASRGSHTAEVTTAGLRGAIDLKGLTLKASAGAQNTAGDRSPAALLALAGDSSPTAISAVPVDHWALAADLSAEFSFAPNATFAVGYSGVNGKRTSDNGVRGTLTFGF